MEAVKQNLIKEKQEFLTYTLDSISIVDTFLAKSNMVKNIMYSNLKNYVTLINDYEDLIDYYISLKELLDEEVYDGIGLTIKDNIYDITSYYLDIVLDYNNFFEENDISFLETDILVFDNDILSIVDEIENNILTKYDVKLFLEENDIGNKEFFNKLSIVYDNHNLENNLKEITYYVKLYYRYLFINKEYNLMFMNEENIINELCNKYLEKVGIKKENKILRKKIGDKNGC